MNTLRGILGRRIDQIHERLLDGDCPRFTSEFILTDVQPKDPSNRRFSNFCGDLSGRFLGALSLLPRKGSAAFLKRLAGNILQQQGSDGRFGNADLDFVGRGIERSHMPLLWGNGRLLVGLLEYHCRFRDPNVLKAVTRLGDFLVQVSRRCLTHEAAEKLKAQGAAGFICFTQCNEGLVMLGEVTKDSRYIETAAVIAQWILPRGKQHSHGYLTTLRGVLMLYRHNGDSVLRITVEKLFDDLVRSSDYLAMGGVPEYFGWKNDPLTNDPAIAAHSTAEARDEGCSEADFMRLCLQLWQATGRLSYLERAEHCLLNHLLSNQFSNGDFGHRHLSQNGFKPYPHPGRAWWCCTMHALRAFRDVENVAITREKNAFRVNLLLDCDLSDDGRIIKFRQRYDALKHRHFYRGTVTQTMPAPFTLFFRNPEWAQTMALRINGKRVKNRLKAGYIQVNRRWKNGDRIEIEWRYKFRFKTRDNKTLSFSKAISSKRINVMAILYGPWLLAVHDAEDEMYFGEPSIGNSIDLSDSETELEKRWHQLTSDSSQGHLKLNYTHEGFPGKHVVSLRPICQQACSDHRTVDIFLRFRKVPRTFRRNARQRRRPDFAAP